MNNKFLHLLLAAVFGAAFALSILLFLSLEYREATVLIKNQSGSALTEVTVHHNHGQIKIGRLSSGQEQAVSVYVPGENASGISARLPSGVVLSGGSAYIESGYCSVVVIGPKSVSAETHLIGCWL